MADFLLHEEMEIQMYNFCTNVIHSIQIEVFKMPAALSVSVTV
jgi:hypothetical protein